MMKRKLNVCPLKTLTMESSNCIYLIRSHACTKSYFLVDDVGLQTRLYWSKDSRYILVHDHNIFSRYKTTTVGIQCQFCVSVVLSQIWAHEDDICVNFRVWQMREMSFLDYRQFLRDTSRKADCILMCNSSKGILIDANGKWEVKYCSKNHQHKSQ